MEFRMNLAQMNDAIRRAVLFDTSKVPYEVPSYPYVWRYNKDTDSIRLEMGQEADNRRISAMFTFQVNGPPMGVGVLVHVSVWFIDPTLDAGMPGWSAVHSV